MPVSRRRRWHAELAAAVQGHGSRRREDALQTATWSLDSDEQPSTGRCSSPRPRRSGVSTSRWPSASPGRRCPPAAESRSGWRCRRRSSARVGARKPCRSSLRRRGGGPTPEDVAEVADARAHVLNLVGRPVEASEVLAAASASVPPAIAERLDARAAVLSLFAGRVQEALDAVDRLVAAYSGDWDQLPELLRVRCDYVASLALALAGRYQEAEQVATASFAFLTEVARPRMPAEQALIARVVAYLHERTAPASRHRRSAARAGADRPRGCRGRGHGGAAARTCGARHRRLRDGARALRTRQRCQPDHRRPLRAAVDPRRRGDGARPPG